MNSLINNLKSITQTSPLLNYVRYIKSYNSSDWIKYKIDNPDNYEKEIIFENDNFELVLISWSKNSITNSHNHPKNGCIMKVLEGELLETTFNEKKILDKNDTNMRNHGEYHTIKANKESYSLHLYSPPRFYN